MSANVNGATVLAVTSGKGGVGKTNVTVNVALSLARLGYRVGLIDADFGLGNIDVMLGLTPDSHIGHLCGLVQQQGRRVALRAMTRLQIDRASSINQAASSRSSSC